KASGDYYQRAANLIELPKFPHSRGPCFPAGTPVATPTGAKAVESVRPDDRVWAFDLATGKWKLRQGVETDEHDYDGEVVALSVAGEVIEATSNHPFWVSEGEGLDLRECSAHASAREPEARVPGRWVEAGDLRVGDVLLLKIGRRAAVTGLSVREAPGKGYNFHLEETAT